MKPLIAIIDDEQSITEVWADYLGEDYQIQTSNDPEVFIKDVLTAERKPDVIITDLMMPQVRGQDLINRLKEEGINSQFIIVSAYANKADAIAAINSGVLGLIEKPVKPRNLKTKIDELLSLLEHRDDRAIFHQLCQILLDRSEDLVDRLYETENLCSASGTRLFKDREGMKRYNDFQKREKDRISEVSRLMKSLTLLDE